LLPYYATFELAGEKFGQEETISCKLYDNTLVMSQQVAANYAVSY